MKIRRWINSLAFFFLTFPLCFAANATYTTLTGTFIDAQGTPLEGSIVMTPPFAGLTTLEGGFLSPTPVTFPIHSGTFFNPSSPQVITNDDILPAGTYYSVQLFDSSSTLIETTNVYVVNGPTFNLGQAILTSVTTSNVSLSMPLNGTIIYAIPGETIAHAVSRLPVGGGMIQLSGGTFASGGVLITTPNITIVGSGAPTYNSQTNPTALNVDGTVVLGPIIAQQGADGLSVRHLGVDCGPTWSANNGNAIPGACLGIFNAGQAIGAPPVQNPVFSDITCLGVSVSAAAHCLIQENVHKGIIEDSRSFFMTHGMVQKGYDNYMSNVTAQGHSSDCFIFKSDIYAPGGRWKLKNFSCTFGAALGDSQGIVVQANNGGNVQLIEISNGDITGQTGRGIILWGVDNADQLLQTVISNVNFDSENASAYCLVNQGYVSYVTMTGFNCFNSASGGIANLSIGTQNDFNYSNGVIANITGNGIDTIGRTHVTGVDFINISGNAIQTENSGITYDCNNSFSAIGGTNLGTVGSGSYRWCNNSTTEDTNGNISFGGGLGPGKSPIASFAACTSALEGEHAIATTCNAGCAAGNSCTTGGANHCEMYCNSSPAWVETGR